MLPALGIIIYDIGKLFKIFGVKETADHIEINENLTKSEEDKQIEETLERIKRTRELLLNEKANINEKTNDY